VGPITTSLRNAYLARAERLTAAIV